MFVGAKLHDGTLQTSQNISGFPQMGVRYVIFSSHPSTAAATCFSPGKQASLGWERAEASAVHVVEIADV